MSCGDELRGDLLRSSAHIACQRQRACTIELAAEADGGNGVRDRTRAVQDRDRHDRDAVNVIAAIDAEALAAYQIDLLSPGVVARRVVPAQQTKSLFDLLRRLAAKGGDASPRRADQGGKPAPDIDM